MLKRYGDKALEESATRVDELTAAGDDNGAATCRRITTAAVGQLANNTRDDPAAPILRLGRFILDNVLIS
jgi:hypothetical protein